MKRPGSVCEYKAQRFVDLRKVVVRLMNEADGPIDPLEMYEKAVNSPAPRFYISEERASVVVSLMKRGLPVACSVASRREMYEEIYRRYVKLHEQYPHRSLCALCSHIINSPAPKFYLTPKSAREFFFRHTRAQRKLRESKSPTPTP